MNAVKRIVYVSALLALLLIFFSFDSNRPAQAQGGGGIQGPFYGKPIPPTKFNGDLRALPKAPLTSKAKGLPLGSPSSLRSGGPLLPTSPDRVRQNRLGRLQAPTNSINFQGLSGADPPDMNIDVGPNEIIETINVIFAIYDKTGNLRAGPFNISSLFSANGGTGTACDSSGPSSDPVVLYDQQANRWVITILAWDNFFNGPYRECIAVSQTADPVSGGWFRYAFVTSNSFLSDFPKLGVWPDAYYMMADMFDEQQCGASPLPPCPPNQNRIETFQYVQVWALDRAAMLSGGTLNNVTFTVSNHFSMVPSNFKGTPPPAGRPNYFGEVDFKSNSNKIHIWRFALNGAWPSPPATFTGPTDVTVTTYNTPTQNAPQPSTNVTLDVLSNRLIYQFQYRNIGGTESLWADHTVNAGNGVNGMRWYQLNVTNNVIAGSPVQQGTYSPDSTHRWMGHLAADRFGNMALGYSASSSSVNPSVRYTGRLVSDAAGTLQAEATLVNGSGTFSDCTAPCNARWGDYSAMEVDPVDDCTFWYVGEYVDSLGNTTRIGSFRFPACAADVAVTKSGPATVIAGTDLTYHLTVTNNGPVGAQVVRLTDATPANTTFVSLVQNTGPTFNCALPFVGFPGTVTCAINALANGASATFTMVVHVSPSAPNGSSISNTVSVTTTSNDPNSSNNSSTSNTTVLTSADLVADKSATTDPVIAGTNETYTLSVTNNGPSDAQNVTLTDATPTNTTFVSLAQNTGPAFTCTTPPSGGIGNVSCTLATLPAGASATFSFVVHVSPSAPDGSTLSNTASVSSSTTDPNPGNNATTITTGVIARADLSITKSQMSSLVIADTNETYNLSVTNNGPSDAQNVTLTDATPTNTTFVSFVQNTGSAFTCTTPASGGTGNVSCTLATLAVGASATFTLVVRISPVDTPSISNTASIAASTIDPNPGNNSAKVTAVDSVKNYKQHVLTDLITLRGAVTDKQDGKKLDDAIKHLANSLAPSLWVDGNTLVAKGGDKVFREQKDAVGKLIDLLKNNNSGISGGLQGFINRLVAADRALADIAINQAISAGDDPNQIAQAQNELAQGNSSATAGKYIVAIEHYRNAWKHAQQAMKK
jgi:uncharacterized repeat protein (TIGR01451 family)